MSKERMTDEEVLAEAGEALAVLYDLADRAMDSGRLDGRTGHAVYLLLPELDLRVQAGVTRLQMDYKELAAERRLELEA